MHFLRTEGHDIEVADRAAAVEMLATLDPYDYYDDEVSGCTLVQHAFYVVDTDDGEVVEPLEGKVHPIAIHDGWPVVYSSGVWGDAGGVTWTEHRQGPDGQMVKVKASTWYQCRATGEVLGEGYEVSPLEPDFPDHDDEVDHD